MTAEVLDRFSPATAEWFRSNFAAPTAAQAGAWESIATGRHALVVAPTGSGKTLAAFLSALDRLATTPAEDPARRCRVLYISPLKALAVDVERNLRAPLVGIGHAATRLGLPVPDLRVGVRSGDTPADERRNFTRQPPDILITTPESLFLLLTSAAREALRGVETVILDEVHAVAGTKRGAHLALSLERLDALLPRPAQRIGLSATVRPIEEVGRFLAGGRPVDIVAPPSEKRWQLDVVVPVPDLAAIGDSTNDLSGLATSDPQRTSIWPHVEEQILDLVMAHRSTLVFANSRRLAERLTARLNELWWERTTGEAPDEVGSGGFERIYRPNRDRAPAEAMGGAGQTHGAPVVLSADADRPQPGTSQGAPGVVARAHHGSVSREQRQQIEEDLKSGRLPAVVATSSLELGIDMGAVDLVVQVEAPPSVASGLQRVGRAGHQVGAVSHGVLFPKFRGDLVQTAVTVERMRAGAIEALRIPANPLDVLAQQIVAMVALDSWTVTDLEALVRRGAPFTGLTRAVLESVLDMLSGRYPSDEFAELRPRLVWDRTAGTLTGRRNAQRLAVTSGGTIPDRGLYGVFLAGEGEGRRVGELDEEMVYESRVGDIFALGTSSWRIEQITHDRVLVTPAPGMPARLPFWKGDALGRPAELGRALGGFVREVSGLSPAKAHQRVAQAGLDEWATDNLITYLTEQGEATGKLPTDRQIVVERFHDELGDWQVVVHSPFGSQVHAPWALVVAARLRERYGVDVQAMHADDGMVFRLPDTQWWEDDPPVAEIGPAGRVSKPPATTLRDSRSARPQGSPEPTDSRFARPQGSSGSTDSAELLELLFPEPEDIAGQVTAQLGGSALFAARFRECAGRALLLPKRRPDRRQALWQQRQRAAQLLEVASQYPSFPIVLEAVRECVNDVFDVPALVDLLRGIRSREIATMVVDTPRASPFASSLLFGYVAQFLYEGDSPLAERRAPALPLGPSLLAALLGAADRQVEVERRRPGEHGHRPGRPGGGVRVEVLVRASPADHHCQGAFGEFAGTLGVAAGGQSLDQQPVDAQPDRPAPHPLRVEGGIRGGDGGHRPFGGVPGRVVQGGQQRPHHLSGELPGEQRQQPEHGVGRHRTALRPGPEDPGSAVPPFQQQAESTLGPLPAPPGGGRVALRQPVGEQFVLPDQVGRQLGRGDRQDAVEDRGVIQPRGVGVGVVRQPVAVVVGGLEPPLLAGQHGGEQRVQPLLRDPRARFSLHHLADRPGGQRRLGQRHPDALGHRAGLVQPRQVARRQVVAGGQHPEVVHHVRQLAVLTREPQHQGELLAGQCRIAVPQPERDEVGIPLPQRDVAQPGGHHRPGVAGGRQVQGVRAQHPPAQGGHRLQVGPHHRAPGEPRPPLRPGPLQVPGVVGLGDHPQVLHRPGEPAALLQRQPPRQPGRGAVHHLQPGVAAQAEGLPRQAERGGATELDPVRQHRADRQRTPVRPHHPEPLQQQALLEVPLVLRGRDPQPAVRAGHHQQPGAGGGEGDLGEVDQRPGLGGQVGHRPPSPELAIELMILRWPITKATSIGIVAIAEAAITRP